MSEEGERDPLFLHSERLATAGPRSLWLRAAAMIALVVAPTLLRAAFTPLIGQQLPFVTYFPAIMAAALWLGWRSGAVVMMMSGVTANLLFTSASLRVAAGPAGLFAVAAFLVSAGSIVALAGALRAALMRLEGARVQERALNAELQHRVKNILAIVQAMASQTLRFTRRDPDEFYPLFQARLHALARAHDLLSSGHWRECRLPELAAQALDAFHGRPGDRIDLSGAPASLPAACCVPLVLALHELATNAMKYGALSREQGRVSLSWRPGADEARLILRWVETGGPPVTAPERRGLGSHLLSPQFGLERVDVLYAPGGVECEIEVGRLP